MQGGKLLKYTEIYIDFVLDRFPTAHIFDESDGVYIVSAKEFGKGIDMWLRSQGSDIEVIQTTSF